MSQALKNLLMADAPAVRDAAFEIAVLARIEQRRFRRGLAAQVVLAAMAALLLALVMPGLQPVWDNSVSLLTSLMPGPVPNLAIGLALMAISAALPLWRRVD
jgi:hypothetical protein